MLRMFFLVAALIGCFGFAGCDFPEQKRPVAGIGGVDIDPGTTMSGGSSTSDPSPAQATNPPAPTSPPVYRTTAEVGDSGFRKGQGYGRTSVFGSNVASFYRMQERIGLELITYNMNMYKAQHDGRGPKTHEEFMKEIIEFGRIKLPELKEGCYYEYNPQTEELEIVHPL